MTVPVLGGRLALGTWQSIVVVDTNVDNPTRTVRLSFLAGDPQRWNGVVGSADASGTTAGVGSDASGMTEVGVGVGHDLGRRRRDRLAGRPRRPPATTGGMPPGGNTVGPGGSWSARLRRPWRWAPTMAPAGR